MCILGAVEEATWDHSTCLHEHITLSYSFQEDHNEKEGSFLCFITMSMSMSNHPFFQEKFRNQSHYLLASEVAVSLAMVSFHGQMT
jgi:hypothetical protein